MKETLQEDITKGIYYFHRSFSNFDECISRAKNEPPVRERYSCDSRAESNPAWAGTKTFDEALKLATFGWPEGLQEIYRRFNMYRNVFTDILPTQDVKEEMTHDVAGEFVDVSRAVEGNPDAMVVWSPPPLPDSNKIVVTGGNKLQRIIINGAINCSINSESLFNWGAVTILLVEQMEMHGFRTELIYRSALGGSQRDKQTLVYDIVLKQFTESPDFNKLAFALAHTSMTRRLVMALEESENTKLQKMVVDNSYGYPKDWKADLVDKNDLYIPMLDSNYPVETVIRKFKDMTAVHFDVVILDYSGPENVPGSKKAHKPNYFYGNNNAN